MLSCINLCSQKLHEMHKLYLLHPFSHLFNPFESTCNGPIRTDYRGYSPSSYETKGKPEQVQISCVLQSAHILFIFLEALGQSDLLLTHIFSFYQYLNSILIRSKKVHKKIKLYNWRNYTDCYPDSAILQTIAKFQLVKMENRTRRICACVTVDSFV